MSQANDRDDRTDVEQELETIVLGCFEEKDFDVALEAACARSPARAGELRLIATELRRFGMVEQPQPEEAPERLGDFVLGERLGAGGMGVVYRAVEEKLGRDVAVKVVRPEHLFFDGSRARFQREIEAVARLQHPGIVPIYSVGAENDVPFFAMELVEGRTLDAILAGLHGRDAAELTGNDLVAAADGRQRGWVEACLDIVAQVADALQHAHERGVYHRDVKPSNVILTGEGRARLLDFGLAFTADSQRLTRTTSHIGSLPYLPPEQIEDSSLEPGARQDVYALGVTLYEILTLRCPFLGKRAEETRTLVLEANPKRPRDLNATIPWDVETVCLAAMDRDPVRRYASVADLRQDLENLRAKRTIQAKRPRAMLRLRRWEQRHPAAALAVFLTVVFVAIGFAVVAVQQQASRIVSDRLTEEAQRSAYAARIVSAGLSLELGNLVDMRAHLDMCAPELRGWEWHWLDKHRDTSRLTLYGHLPDAFDVAWSADGALLACVAGEDKAVRVWRVATGELVRELRSPQRAEVNAVAWSPDGTRIAIGGSDGLEIQELATGKVVAACLRRDARILRARFTPDGSAVLGSDETGPIYRWDAASGKPRATLRGHSRRCQTMCFDDRGRLLTGSGDRTARLWDLSGKEPVVVLSHRYPIHSAHFAKRPGVVETFAENGTMTAWDIATQEALGRRVQIGPRGKANFQPAAATADGEWQAAMVGSRGLQMLATWNSRTGRSWQNLYGHTVHFDSLQFSPDGKLLAAGAFDGSVRVWNRTGGKRHHSLRGHRRAIYAATFGVEALHLVTCDSAGNVHLLDGATNEILAQAKPHTGKIHDVVLDRASGLLVTASADKTLAVLSATTLDVVRVIEGHETAVLVIAVTPDGRHIVSGSDNGMIRVWDTATGTALAHWRAHESAVTGLVYLPGAEIVSASRSGELRRWDLSSIEPRGEIASDCPEIMCLGIGPDGNLLVCGTAKGTVHTWDLSGRTPARTLLGHSRPVQEVAVSPDGRRIFSAGGYDLKVRIWDTTSGLSVLALDAGVAFALALSPDGNRLLTGGMKRRPVLWEVELPFEPIRVGEPPADPLALYRQLERAHESRIGK